jgi:hypothetical protein
MLTRRILLSLAPLFTLENALANNELVKLPDTEISQAGDIKAWLNSPTTRYAHGVLGDAIEAGGFSVQMHGKTITHILEENAVFEDRRVRLHDITGDGKLDAIIIKSYLQRGASIAVYRLNAHAAITPLVESKPIGTPNRWLNIIGIANFLGTGEPIIAAVVTPHLRGIITLYAFRNGELTPINSLEGYTNHIIGERNLDLARYGDVNGDGIPEIIIPTRERMALAVLSFKDNVAKIIRVFPTQQRIKTLSAIKGARIIATFENGLSQTITIN